MELVPDLASDEDLQPLDKSQGPAAGYDAGNIDVGGHRVVLGLISCDNDRLTWELD